MTPTRTSPRTAHTAAVALRYADDVVVRCVRDIHRAVARRVFRAVPASLAPRVAHDAVSAVAYAGVSGGLLASSAALRRLADGGASALVEDGPRARLARSAVNALVGDDLAARDDPYALAMTVRVDGADVAPAPEALAAAYPAATGEIAVLVHGLGENDESWDRGDATSAYDRVLGTRAAVTGVRLRYNTGRHISDNGADLADLLGQLVEAWPVPVARIHLIGHSMGGLVARAAIAQGERLGARWTEQVATVVCLGSPHLGASLEQAVHLGARGLRVVGETAAFAALLDRRSVGIVDLRHGYLTREEWQDRDLSAHWGDGRTPLEPLACADHYFVAATLTRSPGHPLGVALGDLVVGYRSASGDAEDLRAATSRHLPAAGHLSLLNHPQVAEWLLAWTAA